MSKISSEAVRFPDPNPFFSVFALTFWAVTVSAGVVTDAYISTFITSIDMTAQSRVLHFLRQIKF